jgi:two-component sensor histidine kinase
MRRRKRAGRSRRISGAGVRVGLSSGALDRPILAAHIVEAVHACGRKEPARPVTGCIRVESFLKFLPSPGQPVTIRYGLTIVLVAVFFVLRLGAGDVPDPHGLIFFIPPVLLASILFDRGSGFVATGVSVLAIGSLLDWQADPWGHLAAVTLFSIVGMFVAVFCEGMRKALERGLAAQQELQLLFQEQRHRIKNDLALASSLIALQARSQSSLPVRAALESAVARLHVIAESQDHLQFATGDQAVNMREYLEELCWKLGEALRDVRPIAVRVDSDDVIINSRQATRIGLIVSELATNALKYAFPGDRAGTIQVRLRRGPTNLTIIVEDNGIGCPEDAQGGLGTRLVPLLAQQSGGSIKRESATPGYRVVITIPNGLSVDGDAQ